MSKSKQTTLFQNWGYYKNTNNNNHRPNSTVQHQPPKRPSQTTAKPPTFFPKATSFSKVNGPVVGLQKQTTGRLNVDQPSCSRQNDVVNLVSDDEDDDFLQQMESSARDVERRLASEARDQSLAGFDTAAGQCWIYPINFPKREYQYNIVSKSLFKNTLVSLPTGLGKTFIAAVVMYNFYRWYPAGKILFVAPTRPLVDQQIKACYEIMGIDQSHMLVLTGQKVPASRTQEWINHRVFFLTPQTLVSDLASGRCPASSVKCVVVDEAHKATGNHAYCQLIQCLLRTTQQFRVLALSATPGNDFQTVQQVLQNLLINQVECRTDRSMDVQPYLHGRALERVVVKLTGEISQLKRTYENALEPYVQDLHRCRAIGSGRVQDYNKYRLVREYQGFCQAPPHGLPRYKVNQLKGTFAFMQAMYHGYDLLIRHGMRALFLYLKDHMNTNKNGCATRIQRDQLLSGIWDTLKEKYSDMSNVTLNASVLAGIGRERREEQFEMMMESHPKLPKLRSILLEHFERHDVNSRAIVFSEYRNSVVEITDFLRRERPRLRAAEFTGQGSRGTSSGKTQREQLKTVRDFTEGRCNVLISTCVGEEGLDIGEVDLIVFYDAISSPTRSIQRMGRTGRKKHGKIVVLLSEGREEAVFNHSQYSKQNLHKTIFEDANRHRLVYYNRNPRMIPTGLNPQPCELMIEAKAEFDINRGRKRKFNEDTEPRRPGASSAFLNDDELQRWNRKYKIDETLQSQLLKLPKFGSALLTFQGSMSVNDETVDLSEYQLWQDSLQECGRGTGLCHSSLSERFVNAIRASVGPETVPSPVVPRENCHVDNVVVDSEARPAAAGAIDKFCRPIDPAEMDEIVFLPSVGPPKQKKKRLATRKIKQKELPTVVTESEPQLMVEMIDLKQKYRTAVDLNRITDLIVRMEDQISRIDDPSDVQPLPIEKQDSDHLFLAELTDLDLCATISEVSVESAVEFLLDTQTNGKENGQKLDVDLGFDACRENVKLNPQPKRRQSLINVSNNSTIRCVSDVNCDVTKSTLIQGSDVSDSDDDIIPPSPQISRRRRIERMGKHVISNCKENLKSASPSTESTDNKKEKSKSIT